MRKMGLVEVMISCKHRDKGRLKNWLLDVENNDTNEIMGMAVQARKKDCGVVEWMKGGRLNILYKTERNDVKRRPPVKWISAMDEY